MVLDGDDGVAGVDEPLEHAEQPRGVRGVEAGGRLVEQVQRAAGRATAEFLRELDALRLAAGQHRRRLAQLQVAEPDIGHALPPHRRRGHATEERERFLDGHVEHLRDVVTAVPHGEHLALEAAPATGGAAHPHVGQEVHLHVEHARALAALAAAAGHVEREVPRREPALARVGGRGERLADRRERLGVGRRVRARHPADGLLIDGHDLVEMFPTIDPVVRAGRLYRAVEPLPRGAVEDVDQQRRFTRPRRTGHGDEEPERQPHGDVLEVVCVRAADDQRLAVAGPARRGNGHDQPAGEIVAGDRAPARGHLRRRAHGHDAPAVPPRARPDVDDVVGRAQHVEIVLDDEHGVAQVAQAAQHLDQPRVVGGMQADGGFVEHVQHAGEPGAEQRGKAQALGLTRREAGRRALERQVPDADVDQPAHALVQVGDDGLGDEPRFRGDLSVERIDPRGELDERQPRGVHDGEAGDGDLAALWSQAHALAVRAGLVEQESFDVFAVVRVLDALGVAA